MDSGQFRDGDEICILEFRLRPEIIYFFCRSFATFSTSPQTRSKLPLHNLPICPSVYPRRTNSNVTLNASAALFQPSTPPPPSKSDEIPTWSIPISLTA